MWFDKYPFYDQRPAEGVRAAGGVANQPAPQQQNGNNQDEGINEDNDAGNNGHQGGGFSESENKEQTRGKMASAFIIGFFMVIVLCFIYAGWSQAPVGEVKDMVIAVIGALSGLIGFVIGYYFKTKD